MPYALHIWCQCGHCGSVPIDHVDLETRDRALSAVRCSKCGCNAVAEYRMGYVADANALDGSRVD